MRKIYNLLLVGMLPVSSVLATSFLIGFKEEPGRRLAQVEMHMQCNG